MKSSKLIVLALFAISAAHPSAHGQTSAARAEARFRQGKDLIAHRKVAEACAAFEASQKFEPTVATLSNQADRREKNGQRVTVLEPRLSTLTITVPVESCVRGLGGRADLVLQGGF